MQIPIIPAPSRARALWRKEEERGLYHISHTAIVLAATYLSDFHLIIMMGDGRPGVLRTPWKRSLTHLHSVSPIRAAAFPFQSPPFSM